MQHQGHIAMPKISKVAASKLPGAFNMPSNSTKRPAKSVQEEPKISSSHPAVETKDEQKQLVNKIQKKQRKSKNPVLPIKMFIKQAEEFAKQLREANMNFNSNRFSKYSFENEGTLKGRIKYENCLTLSIIRKNATGCLKKVFHVPTMTVHLLKQSLISANFDKNELTEWINIVNKQQSSSFIRILQVYWNMPEDYYSLLYDYSDGVLLDSLNQSLHTFPLSILKQIATAHLTSGIGIFNSHLILQQQQGFKVIRYLPIYQESDFLLSEFKKMKQIAQSELGSDYANNQSATQRKLMWKLGVILLSGYLGSVILSYDIQKVQLPLKQCCLFHQILKNDSSMTSLYLSLNSLEDQALASFLCKCLRSRKTAEGEHGVVQLKHLRAHRFMAKKYTQIVSLGEMIDAVDPSVGSNSQVQISKMSRIMESVSMILQNVSGYEVNISTQNQCILWLAKELGMSHDVNTLVAELKKAYRLSKA